LSIDELQKATEKEGLSLADAKEEQIIQVLSLRASQLSSKLEEMEMFICSKRGKQLILDQPIDAKTAFSTSMKKTFSWFDTGDLARGVTSNMVSWILGIILGTILMPVLNLIRKAWMLIIDKIKKLLDLIQGRSK
jgi:hypothetical protein